MDPSTTAPAPRRRFPFLRVLLVVGALFSLLCCGSVVGGGFFFWPDGEKEETTVVIAEPPAPEGTEEATADADEPTDVEKTVVIAEPVEDKPGAFDRAWNWAFGEDEEKKVVVIDDDTPLGPEPPPESGEPTTTVRGFKPANKGRAFLAADKAGVERSTVSLVLAEIGDSERSAEGLTETYWVQGTHAGDDGERLDKSDKVVDPDVLRREVGVTTKWVAIPGYTGVYAKCVATHGDDTDKPADCTPVKSTASR